MIGSMAPVADCFEMFLRVWLVKRKDYVQKNRKICQDSFDELKFNTILCNTRIMLWGDNEHHWAPFLDGFKHEEDLTSHTSIP